MRIVIDKKRFSLVVGTGTLLIFLLIVCVSNLKGNRNEDKNVKNDVTNKVEIQKNEITKQDFLEEYTKISNKLFSISHNSSLSYSKTLCHTVIF